MMHQPRDSDAGLPPTGGSGGTDPQASGVCVFRTKDDQRVAIRVEKVEAVLELEEGAQIVTSTDVYRVIQGWPEVAGAIWPELFHG